MSYAPRPVSILKSEITFWAIRKRETSSIVCMACSSLPCRFTSARERAVSPWRSVPPAAGIVPLSWFKSYSRDLAVAICAFTSSTAISISESMSRIVKKIEIRNKLGLHARAAALLVQTVNKFSAQVTFPKDGQTTGGRSIMGVLTLAATQGSKIQVEANGDDAERTVKAIERLIENRFNENE